jgi:succinate dehydrogenase / fumarate reductase cytochrome b subunit
VAGSVWCDATRRAPEVIGMSELDRPLSPHLQIYRWYLTMALSILHRASGLVLAAGLLLLTWWLTALARGPEAFATVRAAIDNPLGGLVLFGFTLATFYHMANGVRHLLWDLGYGLEKDEAHRSGLVVLAFTGVATLVVWLAILLF